ncbi:hypothetical protein BD324DRAFT_648480 [Kockovaella imperatae]|uniref:PH domain-containing protein n=1 Tax=Kockovaella imperatae TaxID=4999 RepID=A0A1Y1UP82_9TREE|nr:hypothetical protein BD324DRAFT_648480 [Kockovaella imperatae]ORX39860.1 hypothetical protein BD324DRAFT_648480 [Kockovaella imperatae]
MPSLFVKGGRRGSLSLANGSEKEKQQHINNVGGRKSMDGDSTAAGHHAPSAFHPGAKLKTLLGKKTSKQHLDASSETSSQPNGHSSTQPNGSSSTTSPASPVARQSNPSVAEARRSSLSQTLSPESAQSSSNGTWQASYPTVVDDSYADISPDGHLVNGGTSTSPKSPVTASENATRRLEGKTRGHEAGDEQDNDEENDALTSWPAIKPSSPSTSSSPSVNAMTSPKSATTPSLASPLATTPSNSSPLTPATPPPKPTIRSRPDMPLRKSTLISSPPMPQPIKNLPTLVGLLELGSGIPGNGNMPRTPGWGGLMSPRFPGTPGTGAGFPWSLPSVPTASQAKDKPTTDEEARKMRRAMPSLLREPSVLPAHDGGDVGADDDDDTEDESEPEMEHMDGDSEDETEQASESSPSSFHHRLKGKGKGKVKERARASTGVSSLATSVVREEDTSPGVGIITTPRAVATKTDFKSWALPTPGATADHSAPWAKFSAETPAAPTPAFSFGRAPMSTERTVKPDEDGYFSPHYSQSQSAASGAPAAAAAAAAGPAQEGVSSNAPDTRRDSIDASSITASAEDSEETAEVATAPSTSSRPSFYSRPSRSMVNLSTENSAHTPETGSALIPTRSRERPHPTQIKIPARLTRLEAVLTPGSEWKRAPPTPAAGFNGYLASRGLDKNGGPLIASPSMSRSSSAQRQLTRRLSADDLTISPPRYTPPEPGVWIPKPREEEGREQLPKYWCAVHMEGQLTRKNEFSAPGVQARDRSWKKMYFIVRGTSLIVYRFDPHRFPLKAEAGPLVENVSEAESKEHLHVHVPGEVKTAVTVPINGIPPAAARRNDTRRASLPGSESGASGSSIAERRMSVSSTTSVASEEKDAQLFPNRARSASTQSGSSAHSGTTPISSHFRENQLIKQYTLQNAESGLAADYLKRRNVVRVRAEGEQFLLQTDSARDVVDWIEALQAGTNVALDLDDRPMPKIITLPRRRRRRIPGAPGATAAAPVVPATVAASVGAATGPDTAAANVAAVIAAERASGNPTSNRSQMERMLVEDQAAVTAA